MRSYNKSALRGYAYSDKEFQEDMEKVGVFIPEELLFTPKGPEYVIKHFRDSNELGYINEGMSAEDAKKSATEVYNTAMKGYKDLLSMSNKKK